MIEPKEIKIQDKIYFLSKIPATIAYEIIARYPFSLLPKVGDYTTSREMMLRILSYVAVPNGGAPGGMLKLSTEELVNAHVKDWWILIKLQKEMVGYNADFFPVGEIWTLLKDFAQSPRELTTETLMDLSGRLFQKIKQHSMN